MALPDVNPTYYYVDNQGTGADGAIFGKSVTSLIGFYGKAPTVQTSLVVTATASTTLTNIVASLNAIVDLLKAKGLCN